MLLSMNEGIKKEILYDITQALKILEERETTDIEELKVLSDHAIEDIAVQKDLELVTITVLLYSIYKVVPCMQKDNYQKLVAGLTSLKNALQRGDLGGYNRNIKNLYALVRQCNAKVQEHLQDVMHAARIKKGTSLLQRGLSIGQAAGLMGLSNWDLQPYAGKTTALGEHDERIPAQKRVVAALTVFGMRP